MGAVPIFWQAFVVLFCMMKTELKIIIGDSRRMREVKDELVHLVITSPPYWQLKDYRSVFL
ncbi:hypothetical protein ES703_55053 [subsurface metagenome]